jgi:hypothetical protein
MWCPLILMATNPRLLRSSINGVETQLINPRLIVMRKFMSRGKACKVSWGLCLEKRIKECHLEPMHLIHIMDRQLCKLLVGQVTVRL